ncbi:MAG: hypothetical protein MH213_05365, partial [Marinobacter sp.]|nr:hypothetical protein [Marinobacter sp.]
RLNTQADAADSSDTAARLIRFCFFYPQHVVLVYSIGVEWINLSVGADIAASAFECLTSISGYLRTWRRPYP